MARQEIEERQVDPIWWLYKITEEQIEQIKAENGEVIRRFWEENESIIMSIIRAEINRYYVLFEKHLELYDCISQVYVDLPKYRYKNSRDITYGIYRSVKYCAMDYTAYNKEISLDFELKDGFTLGETLIGKCDIEDCFDYSFEKERAYYKVAIMLFSNDLKKRDAFLRRL